MSKIKIDHAQVRNLSKTYSDANDTIDDIMTKLKSTQSSLNEVWDGKAWDQFDETYKEFAPKVKEFGEFLGSVADQLKANAETMEKVDLELQKSNKLGK